MLFYSKQTGSGNSNTWQMTLPAQPTAPVLQSGLGASRDFQLHPAFWFGMAMCDSQSSPSPGTACNGPDSDANIYNDANPASSHYIGKHPGSAFMEMQFYPPGWVNWPPGNSCGATSWCAALNIDSLSRNDNTGIAGNCIGFSGFEYVNFAFITKNGVPLGPPNPVFSNGATFTPSGNTLFMNSGDKLVVTEQDTFSGLRIDVQDITSGQSGFMVASAANGFGQVPYAAGSPSPANCNIPYNFHPMYGTSSEQTRVPWAAHSYNIAYSDEIGHWDYCTNPSGATVIAPGGSCTAGYVEGGTDGATEPTDADDQYCFDGTASSLVFVGGCIAGAGNTGFDGTSYSPQTWPGNGNDTKTPAPIRFNSPYFGGSKFNQYDRVGFETDLPAIQGAPCSTITGASCINPPLTDDGVAAAFYPMFTTTSSTGLAVSACRWQEGGSGYPGTLNTFGGTSTTEYGPLEQSLYARLGGPVFRYENFRNIVANPCKNP